MRSYFFLMLPLLSTIFTTTPSSQHLINTVDLIVFEPPSTVVVDGKTVAVYELHVFNNIADNISLKKLQIRDGNGRNIIEAFDSLKLTTITGSWDDNNIASDPCVVKRSAKAVIYLELPLKAAADVHELLHTLTYSYTDKDVVKVASITGAPTAVIKSERLKLGAPLKGNSWAAVYDPLWKRGHRRVMFRFEGKPHIPARFAIDFIKLDSSGHYASGDKDVISNWYSSGAEVLSVADGVVAAVRNDFPESLTLAAHQQYDSSKATGNYISIDIGNNAFAFYEHLKPNSIRVRAGQKVKKGEVIASLGFTGQSTGPHLHFHVANRNAPLDAEGIPYVFEEFTLAGFYNDFSLFGKESWSVPVNGKIRIRKELPGSNTVIDFPDRP